MFSSRATWRTEPNAITKALEEHRQRGAPLADLTVANPTATGFAPPSHLTTALTRGAAAPYQPDPRGLKESRVALASWMVRHGAPDADPDELFLTSSTSEAYGWIMKLLCAPGERVARFAPTYPLLDHLAALEAVGLETSQLERGDGRWSVVDDEALASLTERVRAIIVVHPNNPTGHFLSRDEIRTLSSHASRSGAALIADEVFFEASRRNESRVATSAGCLTFSLGGLSKSAALPHWKLGWIRVTGPEPERRRAIEAMELIADTYLPVSAPIQHALAEILDETDTVRERILERTETNLRVIDASIRTVPSLRRDRIEGGWSVPIRVPLFESEEQLVIDLIARGVLVHPGFFYDFPNNGWIVVSLLPHPEDMERGMAIIRDYFHDRS